MSYWQRQALAYTTPTDTVVYSTDPRDVATLRSSDYTSNWPHFPTGSYVLRPNLTFQQLINAHTGGTIPVAPAIFLHARQDPSGASRVTAVQLARMESDSFPRLSLVPYVQPTGTPRGNIIASASGEMEIYLRRTDRIRLFDGQPDPADPTHFTIDCAINDVPMTIDGYLKAGDQLTLTPRTGKTVTYSSLTRWSPTGAPMPGWLERIATPATQPAP
jgi:hypothetical protein